MLQRDSPNESVRYGYDIKASRYPLQGERPALAEKIFRDHQAVLVEQINGGARLRNALELFALRHDVLSQFENCPALAPGLDHIAAVLAERGRGLFRSRVLL